ncbi:MAG: NEW3 domain-containing protein [Chloroflexota bacterium]
MRRFVLLLTVLASLLIPSAAASAQSPGDVLLDAPVRALEMGQLEQRVSLDIRLQNQTDERIVVKLVLEDTPAEWDVGVWGRFFDFKISQLVVDAKGVDPVERPTIRADIPDVRPAAGDYSFTLKVTSLDGALVYDQATFVITVPPARATGDAAVNLSSTFPELNGPSTSQFSFEVLVNNDTGDTNSFDLSGEVFDENGSPLNGWDIGFSPTFGEQKLIGAVSVDKGLAERVDVLVSPSASAPPGNYTIVVSAAGAGVSDDTALRLILTGRADLFASTDTGRLSLEAKAGGEGRTVLRLTNIGTADLTTVRLQADRPTGWNVTFLDGTTAITSIPSLPSGFESDIGVLIEPPGDAIPGDYQITLRATGDATSDSIDLRVTVSKSTVWGWLGIVLVLAVVGGLVGLFIRLGRR